VASPFLTIIIPALNEEKYLPSLLADLVKQSYINFDVIVVDGKSTDNTISKINKFHHLLNFKIVISPKRHVSFQRNLGATNAKSNWLLFLDADNRLDPDFLKKLHRHLTKKHPPDCFTNYIRPDNPLVHYRLISWICNICISALSQTQNPTIFGAIFGIQKHIFYQIGGFDPKINFQEDSDLVTRIIKQGYKLTVFTQPTIYYSFRRFSKIGWTKNIINSSRLQFIRLFKSPYQITPTEYPMLGGSYYESQNPKKK
jgi:glycosyltransferase involved in cell wall biosynthesis